MPYSNTGTLSRYMDAPPVSPVGKGIAGLGDTLSEYFDTLTAENLHAANQARQAKLQNEAEQEQATQRAKLSDILLRDAPPEQKSAAINFAGMPEAEVQRRQGVSQEMNPERAITETRVGPTGPEQVSVIRPRNVSLSSALEVPQTDLYNEFQGAGFRKKEFAPTKVLDPSQVNANNARAARDRAAIDKGTPSFADEILKDQKVLNPLIADLKVKGTLPPSFSIGDVSLLATLGAARRHIGDAKYPDVQGLAGLAAKIDSKQNPEEAAQYITDTFALSRQPGAQGDALRTRLGTRGSSVLQSLAGRVRDPGTWAAIWGAGKSLKLGQ